MAAVSNEEKKPGTYPAVFDVGTNVRKHFPGHGAFDGSIVEVRASLYFVRYSDGDEEELDRTEVIRGIQMHHAFHAGADSNDVAEEIVETESSDDEEEERYPATYSGPFSSSHWNYPDQIPSHATLVSVLKAVLAESHVEYRGYGKGSWELVSKPFFARLGVDPKSCLATLLGQHLHDALRWMQYDAIIGSREDRNIQWMLTLPELGGHGDGIRFNPPKPKVAYCRRLIRPDIARKQIKERRKAKAAFRKKLTRESELAKGAMKPSYDSATGLYRRPSGRAPKGAVWNNVDGLWEKPRPSGLAPPGATWNVVTGKWDYR